MAILKDFFVSVGWMVDETAADKAQQFVNRTEAKLTQATLDAIAKKKAAEEKYLADRVNAIISVGAELDKEEQAYANRQYQREKTRQDRLEEQTKKATEKEKKDRDSREKREAEERKRRNQGHRVELDSHLQNLQRFATRFAGIQTVMGAATSVTAAGIVYAADRAAKSLERLNYLSARTGSTPGSMSAFAYASSQLGSSAQVGESSLQEFGQRLKSLPGYRDALQGLIGNIYGKDGNMIDSAELATRLGKRLGEIRDRQGIAVAQARARFFGFDDLGQLNAMADPRFAQLEKQRADDQKKEGYDPNRAATSATSFEQSLRHLETVAEDVGTNLESKVFSKLGPWLDRLADWGTKNSKTIADGFDRLLDVADKFATKMASFDSQDFSEIFGKEGDDKGDKLIPTLVRIKTTFDSIVTVVKTVIEYVEKFSKILQGFDNMGGAGTRFGQWMGILPKGYGGVSVGDNNMPAGPSAPGFSGSQDSLGGSGPSVNLGRHSTPASESTGEGRARFGRHVGTQPAVPYEPGEFTKSTGMSAKQYKGMLEGISGIESGGNYRADNGSHFGRYQFGIPEIRETARSLGVDVPSDSGSLVQWWKNNPDMQERFMERYTLQHYRTLSQNPRFAAMSPRQKAQILGYAHNQGTGSVRRGGGAIGYLNSGRVGTDGNGTPGTAYFGPIGRKFDEATAADQAEADRAKPPAEGTKRKSWFHWPWSKPDDDPESRTSTPYKDPGPNARPPAKRLGSALWGGNLDSRSVGKLPTPLMSTNAANMTSTVFDTSKGDTVVTHNPTFNIKGGTVDAHEALRTAQATASRGLQDTLRNVQNRE